jgi:hypothetical protein
MGATTAPEHDMDAGPADKAAAERTCALTREPLTPETGLRFVAGPDGSIVPDVGRRLPGRGVWLSCIAVRWLPRPPGRGPSNAASSAR